MAATTRWRRGVLIATCALVVGALVGWAGATVLTPHREVLNAAPFTTVEVVDGEVGSSLTLGASAEWASAPVGVNRASGVVTGVHVANGDEVGVGARLYDVNQRPVFIAEGAVPAYRTLASGARGTDVEQLQRMLTTTGHFAGSVDGIFGRGTTAAVRAWQRAVDLPVDGAVAFGDVIFVPTLPARISVDSTLLHRDATLSGGESLISALASEPGFRLTVTPAQAAMIAAGTIVELRLAGHTWLALTGAQTTNPEMGAVNISLIAGGDGPLCGADCAAVPTGEPALLSATVVTVPPTTGLVVPSAALATRADGSLMLIDRDGGEHPVTVLAQARGMSAVEGVEAGLVVRVPGTARD